MSEFMNGPIEASAATTVASTTTTDTLITPSPTLLQGIPTEITSSSSSILLEKKFTIEKDGISTEILCLSFTNRIVIFITQINKIGTLITAWSEPKSDGTGNLYQTNILLGKRDDPLLTIYARQLIEKISIHTNNNKTLLLGISLQEKEGRTREQFQFIINHVLENLIL